MPNDGSGGPRPTIVRPSRQQPHLSAARPVTTVAPQSSSVWMAGTGPPRPSRPPSPPPAGRSSPPAARRRARASRARPTRPGAGPPARRGRRRARPAARGRAPRRAGTRRLPVGTYGALQIRMSDPAAQPARQRAEQVADVDPAYSLAPWGSPAPHPPAGRLTFRRAHATAAGSRSAACSSAQPASPVATASPRAPVPQHRSTITGISARRPGASPRARRPPTPGTRFAAGARKRRGRPRSAGPRTRPSRPPARAVPRPPAARPARRAPPGPRRRQQQRRLVLGEDAPGAPQPGDHGRIVNDRIVAHGTPPYYWRRVRSDIYKLGGRPAQCHEPLLR